MNKRATRGLFDSQLVSLRFDLTRSQIQLALRIFRRGCSRSLTFCVFTFVKHDRICTLAVIHALTTTTRQTTGCAHGASSRRRCRSRGPVAPSSSPLLSRLDTLRHTGAQTISGNRRSSPCIRTRFEDASKRTRSRVSAQGRPPRSPQKFAREKRSRRRPHRTIG